MQQLETVIRQEASGSFATAQGRCFFPVDRRKGLQDTDPRIKILMSLVFSTIVFLTAQKITMHAFCLAAFVLILFSGRQRIGVKFLLAYAFCSILDVVTALVAAESLRVVLGIIVYSFMKFIPVIMLGSWLASTIKVNEFMAALEQMRLPKPVIIPLAVLLRFLPTVKEELGYISDTMKMRNIELSCRGILLNPVRTMEYILVPLLMRSVKVADELSAAALTRGIDSENRRTSLREVRILPSDGIIAAGFILLVLSLWYLDKNVFPGLTLGGLGA